MHRYKKEKERLVEELAQVKERLSRCLSELDRVTDDREKSLSEVFNLKNVVLKMECNKDASVRHLSKQVNWLQVFSNLNLKLLLKVEYIIH